MLGETIVAAPNFSTALHVRPIPCRCLALPLLPSTVGALKLSCPEVTTASSHASDLRVRR
jgi:hypothetical protein